MASAVLPEGWVKSSGYLDSDTTYLPTWSGSVAHANEFRDSADSAWMQIEWGKSGITLATKIGEGLDIWGGNTDDLVKGNDEDNVVHGGDGNDEVRGRQGDDVLTGDDGNDLLKGGKDDDTLLGGAGRDDLKGGRGKDIFAFEAEKDAILDFVRGKDLIDLSAIDARTATTEDDPFDFIGRLPSAARPATLRYRVKADEHAREKRHRWRQPGGLRHPRRRHLLARRGRLSGLTRPACAGAGWTSAPAIPTLRSM